MNIVRALLGLLLFVAVNSTNIFHLLRYWHCNNPIKGNANEYGWIFHRATDEYIAKKPNHKKRILRDIFCIELLREKAH